MCQGILECEVLVGTRSAEGIMASGHVNRIKRPDTWLHRPMLQNVKKVLANPEPSTHGTFRKFCSVRLTSFSGDARGPYHQLFALLDVNCRSLRPDVTTDVRNGSK